jgi:hypothetical protein
VLTRKSAIVALRNLQQLLKLVDLSGMETLKTNTLKPATPLSKNRRQGNRHRLDVSATLTNEGPNPTEVPVVLTEMSVGGMAFRSRQSLPVGATYLVSSFDTLIPHGTRATLVARRRLPDGDFEIGAKTH